MILPFSIYRNGKELELHLPKRLQQEGSTPLGAVTRLCAASYEKSYTLYFVIEENLYCGVPFHAIEIENSELAEETSIQLELLRDNVIDMDLCEATGEFYIVDTSGTVFRKDVADPHAIWTEISFDPLEIDEDGIRIRRVKCNSVGVVFVTSKSEVYAMGNCGDILNSENQPIRLRVFDKEVLDLAAGDDFFVILLRNEYMKDSSIGTMFGRRKETVNKSGTSAVNILKKHQTLEIEFDENDHKLDASSAISLNSTSSTACDDLEENIQEIIKSGYALLSTSVCSFGATNNGVLGLGDHIKRPGVNAISKLKSIGVCSVASGRKHSIVRTLDGRLYHWGLKFHQQLLTNGQSDQSTDLDLSSPKELKLDKADLDPFESSILQACCGDFRTVLLNASGQVIESDKQLACDRQLLTMQSSSKSITTSPPLILTAGPYTLQNYRQFQRAYHQYLVALQQNLQQMQQNKQIVATLQMMQQKNSSSILRQLHHICLSYMQIYYGLAAMLKSLEDFYRGDCADLTQLLFLKLSRECIRLFEDYTSVYCDVRSINGFADAAKVFAHLATHRDESVPDLERVFQMPFAPLPSIVHLLEQLPKNQFQPVDHFTEKRLAWQEFTRQNRINIELADSTHDFWLSNERNAKIRHFRRKHRRVILTSATVPVKLESTVSFVVLSTTFILFSDCLCQVGAQLQTFPLVVMWVKIENDLSLRVKTPEKVFTLVARTHHDRRIWYDQLETSVMVALGRPGANMANVRTAAYVFSAKHSKYPGVHAFGRWRNGVLHGNCYLEYPDGRFYFGELRYGEIEGYGKMVIPSVGLYDGTFKAGKFHGYGSYEMKDNEVYDGNFRDGMFHGHGMLRTNTYTYVGEFQANAKSGYGILDDMITGEKYMGMFADNKRAGAGTCITMNGDYFEGIFVNDELAGCGIAVFENDYYYDGELSMRGPFGKGTYYMPHASFDSLKNENDEDVDDDEDNDNKDGYSGKQQMMIGNVISGHLGGTWNDVRVISGSVAINRKFPKLPKSIGELVVDNNRKWRTLFENFQEQILGTTEELSPKDLWSRVAVYMTKQREREKSREQQEFTLSTTSSYFAKNISMGFSASLDKISLKSTSSLCTVPTTTKGSFFDLTDGIYNSNSTSAHISRGKSHSQDTLFEANNGDSEYDFLNGATFAYYASEENSFNSMLNTQLGSWANDSGTTTSASTRSSFDSVMNLSAVTNNNNGGLEFVPNFGITSLTDVDVAAIKEYLLQAFKDPHHPLFLLNQKIAHCFYTSYGCWKVKPTPIIAKQAMHEWESISKRVYQFVRRLFPALPEDFCVIESTCEVVSHISLLYPIVLSEGIYSTLFVLYANKYSRKDEVYRQNMLIAEKQSDQELAVSVSLDLSLLAVVRNEYFTDAIATLKQVQEKYSPKAMLSVIEKAVQLINEAHKFAELDNSMILAADSMMPLALFMVLRAAVPHLGAELALLDHLTGGSNFEIEMSGIVGYCYTTIKASYEHITAGSLVKS